MSRLVQLIGILLGHLSLYSSLALNVEEIPFVDVQLGKNATELANGVRMHENVLSVRSSFLLNCSYVISGGRQFKKYRWSVKTIAFYLNGSPLGEFKYNEWRNSPEQNRKFVLNVFANYPANYNEKFMSVWIQPLSVKASGNYSCSILLHQDDVFEAKYLSNLFPIKIKNDKLL